MPSKRPPPDLPKIPRTGFVTVPKRDRPPGQPDADTPALGSEKARLTKEQADRLARINRREEGELLPADMVEREWADICTGIRAAMLAIPARLAQRHPGHPEIVATLEREIRTALAELAEDSL